MLRLFRLFRLYATGNYSFTSVVSEMNRLTPEKRWNTRSVSVTLQNPFYRGEYIKRRAELQTALASLDIPEEPAIVQAGEYLESLAGLWDGLTCKEQREVLHIVFADVLVDVGKGKVIVVKPNRDLVPPFRFDGMEEREDGYFYISGTQAAI